MEPQWFYQDGGRKGPVDAAQLVRALLDMPNPRQVKVWREGLTEWIDAGSAAEIAAKLPPPVPGAPFTHTAPNFQPGASAVEAVARNYRNLVLLVGAQLLLAVLLQLVTVPGLALALFVPLAVVAIAMAIIAYKLMADLQAGAPILWAVGIFVPLVNLLVLAGISSKAQEWCKRHGIKVGLLGPTASSLAEFRQRIGS
jgi:hypothetical protein